MFLFELAIRRQLLVVLSSYNIVSIWWFYIDLQELNINAPDSNLQAVHDSSASSAFFLSCALLWVSLFISTIAVKGVGRGSICFEVFGLGLGWWGRILKG